MFLNFCVPKVVWGEGGQTIWDMFPNFAHFFFGIIPKEARDFEIYKFKATARAMLKTSQNRAAMKVESSAAA